MASHTRRLISYIDYAGDSMQNMKCFISKGNTTTYIIVLVYNK